MSEADDRRRARQAKLVTDRTDAYASLWGWEGGQLRLPLPPVAGMPAQSRHVGNIAGTHTLNIPPYLHFDREFSTLFLWRPDGIRATQAADVGALAPSGDMDMSLLTSEWIFADSENVPEEWKQPIADAIEEIKERYPEVTIRFRP